MGNRRKTYKRARRCLETGEKLAGVDKAFLSYDEDKLDLVSIVEETDDLTLTAEVDYKLNNVGNTVVIGERDLAKMAGVTTKYLKSTILPSSSHHAHDVSIGPKKSVLVTHQDSVNAGNVSRRRPTTF